MRTDSRTRLTWFVNSRAMLEPLFRSRERDSSRLPRNNSFSVEDKWLHGDVAQPAQQASSAARRLDETEAATGAVIVVPLDFSPASVTAAQLGVSIARHAHARVIFCHALFPKVIPFGPAAPPWVITERRTDALKKMRSYMEFAREAGLSASGVIEPGTAAGLIIQTARKHAADLIVLAPRSPRSWACRLFGTTTAELVTRQAECHIMILRATT